MKKRLLFKEDEYTFKELWHHFISMKKIYSEGEVLDLDTGETFDISEFYKYKSNFSEEVYEGLKELSDSTTLKRKLKADRDKNKLRELEDAFETGIISPDELRQLIKLKYNSKDIILAMNYEHFIFLNISTEIPNLTDGELGKFYKILFKMTHRANELLKTNNIKSNPVGVNELQELLGISERSVYTFLNKLKAKNIIKEHSKNNKKYYSVNPKYAINGRLNSYSYFLFKEDMEQVFPNVPKEIIKLWEFEYLSNTIES